MTDIEYTWEEEEQPQQPLRIEVGKAPDGVDEALIASMGALVDRLEKAEGRQEEFVELMERLFGMVQEDRAAFTAAMGLMTEALARDPVVNVTVPDFPSFPEIPPPVVNVQPPEVNVTLEAPVSQKKIVVERDPLTGLIASADVTEA